MTTNRPAATVAPAKTPLARLRALYQRYNQNAVAAGERTFSLEAYDDFLEDMPARRLADYVNSAAGRAEFKWDAESVRLFLAYCSARSFRETIYEQFLNLCPGPAAENNLALGQAILETRAQEAARHGYDNYLEYLFSDKAVTSVAAMQQYLTAALAALQPRYQKALTQIAGLARHRAGVQELKPWDVDYFKRMFFDENFGEAAAKFKEHFPLSGVLPRALEIISRGFELKFTPLAAKNRHSTYHYSVTGKNGRRLGTINFDLFTRANKLPHEGYVTARLTDLTAHGRTRRLPAVELNCRFTAPEAGQECLLDYEEIVTLFHEFGHALAELYAGNNPNVATPYQHEEDVLEFYSKFMENFIYDEKVIRHLSGHPLTGRKVPSECFRQTQHGRRFLQIFETYSQLINAQIDLELNLAPTTPIRATVARIYQHHDYSNFSAFNYACAPEVFAPRHENYVAGNAYCYPLCESVGREVFRKYQRAAGNLLSPKDFSVPDKIFAQTNRRPFLTSYEAVTGRKKLNLTEPCLG